MSLLFFLFFFIVGYLCGSFCSAIIVSRLFSLPDPRVKGSLNPGATNVLRLAGKKYAIIVLFGDMLKGFIPVILSKSLGMGPIITSFTCLAAVLGHMYPIFFKFQGGKGVATALGGLFGLNFLTGIATIAIWLIIANFTGYASLASMISLVLAPLYASLGVGNVDVFLPLFFMAFLILYKHRNNINRLIDGEEPKLTFSRQQFSEVADDIIVDEEVNNAFEEEEKIVNTASPEEQTADLEEPTQVADEPVEQSVSSDSATPEINKQQSNNNKDTSKPSS